jgi:hypothetical protein
MKPEQQRIAELERVVRAGLDYILELYATWQVSPSMRRVIEDDQRLDDMLSLWADMSRNALGISDTEMAGRVQRVIGRRGRA